MPRLVCTPLRPPGLHARCEILTSPSAGRKISNRLSRVVIFQTFWPVCCYFLCYFNSYSCVFELDFCLDLSVFPNSTVRGVRGIKYYESELKSVWNIPPVSDTVCVFVPPLVPEPSVPRVCLPLEFVCRPPRALSACPVPSPPSDTQICSSGCRKPEVFAHR